MVKKPKVLEKIDDEKRAQKLIKLIESLEDHDDVQEVYTNADIDDKFLE